MKIDLHTHSILSDGTCEPKEIVDKAKSIGLDCLSITDHDCIRANVEVGEYAASLGIQYVNGVELSTYSNQEIHILGYCFDEDNAQLLDKLNYFEKKRRERAETILDRLFDVGVKLDRDKLPTDSASVGRLHIAKLMVNEGYAANVSEAFDRYLGPKGKAYFPSKRITPMQGVELISKAHGLAVIAHPSRLVQRNLLSSLIEGLKPFGLEGVEAYYPTHDDGLRGMLLSLAKRHKLIATGGSDFHGENRNVELGSVNYNLDAYTASKLGIKITK